MNRVHVFTCVALLAGLVSLSGCESKPDNPPTFPVTGTVTYKGNPVPNATVSLSPLDMNIQGASGTTDENGKFEVMTFEPGDGAMPGEYQVRVSAYELVAEPTEAAASEEPLTLEDEEAMYDGQEDVEPSQNLLPKKYENAATSGLTHTVPEAASELILDLK